MVKTNTIAIVTAEFRSQHAPTMLTNGFSVTERPGFLGKHDVGWLVSSERRGTFHRTSGDTGRAWSPGQDSVSPARRSAPSRFWFVVPGSLHRVCSLRDNQHGSVTVRSAEACGSVGYDNCFSVGVERN